MGTYTTNYQLYMPTVGETGWGTLVNGNFTTIDTTMKSLNTRLTAVENEVNGNLSCTSVTTSGKITGNGGIAGTTGTFSGDVTAKNISKYGVIPYTLCLYSSTEPTDAVYSYTGPYSVLGGVTSGATVGRTIISQLQIPDNGTLSRTMFVGLNTDIPSALTNIKKYGGSWSNPVLKTNSEYITATISGISGTINNTTGLTITYAQVVHIYNNAPTFTFKNSRSGSSALPGGVTVEITNTSSSKQYFRYVLSGTIT